MAVKLPLLGLKSLAFCFEGVRSSMVPPCEILELASLHMYHCELVGSVTTTTKKFVVHNLFN